jgi:Amt family ammonium transporter
MRRRILRGVPIVALLMAGPLAAPAAAQTVDEVAAAVDNVWLVVAAALVMLMQAGFALVEAGFTRAKNAANIVMKNFLDFSVGALAYWAFGWALAYGGTEVGRLVATGDWFFSNPELSPIWFFQVVFAATAATIVSGAVAERVKFSAYLIYTPFISGVIYPIVTNWVWGNGWLSPFAAEAPFGPTGMLDFAGSGVVHMVGGVAALAGALVVGPRLGKYGSDGRPRTIPGHSLTLGALGVFILWFGWYGFNAGSTLAAVGADFASVAVTTTLAGAAGAVTAMATAWFVLGVPDVGMTLNGGLAGLVGITAGAGYVTNAPAVLIGAFAGVIVVLSILAIERAGIDDPVGAISVHGTCGLWGVLAVGLFADPAMVGALGLSDGVGGALVGGGFGLLGTQLVGVAAIGAWTFLTSFAVFKAIDLTHGMRVSEEEEREGLDRSEHGGTAYPEFVFQETIAPAAALDPVGSNGEH